MKMEKKLKFYPGTLKSVTENRITVYVSTGEIDRDSEVIEPNAWNIKNYLSHPVLLSSHRYDKLTNQIGKAIDVGVDTKGLWATFEYFTGQGNFEADWAFFLANQGLAAFSVGFIPIKTQNGTGNVRQVYKEVELLEISQVLVPANPEAVQGNGYEGKYLSAIKSFREAKDKIKTVEKGVIPYKKHPLADPNASWDAGKEVKQATPAQLKEMCAWYDSSKPNVKSSYKLPHHYLRNYVTVWRGVATAMATLLGARGGVDIPDSDKQGIYNHLKQHYKEFNKTPPELKRYESEKEILKACGIENEKSGRVISEENRRKIQNAIEALKNAETVLKELLTLSDNSSLGEKENIRVLEKLAGVFKNNKKERM